MTNTATAAKRRPHLPATPPALGRPTVADSWMPLCRDWFADKIGLPSYEVVTARTLIDLHWLNSGCVHLIHAARKFWAWNGWGWYEVDVDDLERSVWAIMRGRKSEKRVKALMYALKFEAAWPPLPTARSA